MRDRARDPSESIGKREARHRNARPSAPAIKRIAGVRRAIQRRVELLSRGTTLAIGASTAWPSTRPSLVSGRAESAVVCGCGGGGGVATGGTGCAVATGTGAVSVVAAEVVGATGGDADVAPHERVDKVACHGGGCRFVPHSWQYCWRVTFNDPHIAHGSLEAARSRAAAGNGGGVGIVPLGRGLPCVGAPCLAGAEAVRSSLSFAAPVGCRKDAGASFGLERTRTLRPDLRPRVGCCAGLAPASTLFIGQQPEHFSWRCARRCTSHARERGSPRGPCGCGRACAACRSGDNSADQ
jgi:hypothetical protein